jgi:hypothetical protein
MSAPLGTELGVDNDGVFFHGRWWDTTGTPFRWESLLRYPPSGGAHGGGLIARLFGFP